MARAQSAGIILAFGLLLGLSLAGAASAKELNLTALLPTSAEIAPFGLTTRYLQPIGFSSLQGVDCDASAIEGMRENLEPVPYPGALPTGTGSVARIVLYRFDSAPNASLFVRCLNRFLANRTNFSQRPAPYGEVGYVAEVTPGAPAGASILFAKGAVMVSIDALNNSFQSATAHALAKLMDDRLPKAEPRKSPGFEAAAAVAGLAGAALVLRRRRSG